MTRHRGFSVPLKKNGPPASPGPNVDRTPGPLWLPHSLGVRDLGPGARGTGPGRFAESLGALGPSLEYSPRAPGPKSLSRAAGDYAATKCKHHFAQPHSPVGLGL